jgi:predicted regulator of Ras-like GTPase activity (Roadblock/LC7/MglB family)
MSHVEDSLLNRPRQRVGTSKQPLVARHTDQDSQLEMLDKLTQLEASLAAAKDDLQAVKSRAETRKLDARTIVALVAIALSLTGYVIQEARNTSRQDAEIEMTKARVSNLERIAAANTEARIRSEVEFKALHEGQEEIKRMLLQHDTRTRATVQRNQ